MPDPAAATKRSVVTSPGTKYGEMIVISLCADFTHGSNAAATSVRCAFCSVIVTLSGSSETNVYLDTHSIGQSHVTRRFTASPARRSAA